MSNNKEEPQNIKQDIVQNKDASSENIFSTGYYMKHAHSFWDDFRTFAFQGDVIDLAVGIIIGGAFNKIVQSLTNDIVMPVFGKILGNADFSNLFINLSDKPYNTLAEATAAGAPVIRYGAFITDVIDFFIIALSLYIFLKIVLKKKNQEKKAAEKEAKK